MRKSVLKILAVAVAVALPGLASASPIYQAATNEAITLIFPCSGSPGGTSSSPIGSDLACGNRFGRGDALAAASTGHVGAKASVAGFDIGGRGSARIGGQAIYSDFVVFTGDPALFPGGVRVSMNLFFGGVMNSAGEANSAVDVSVTLGRSATYHDSNEAGVDQPCTSSFASGCATGIVTTPTVVVALNTPIFFELNLAAVVSESAVASAFIDFSDSLDLPTGIDVFNLPDGVTANAPDSDIFSNRFVLAAAAVPEPSALALLSVGLLGLGVLRRKRLLTPG